MVRIQVPSAYDSDTSITQAELKTYLGTGLIIDQIVQADLYPGTAGVITAGATPSVDPNAGWRNPGILNGATRLLGIFHGGVAREVGIPWGYSPWASLPAVGDIDERYLVTDLQVIVHYRTQVVDEVMSGTGNGLAGWHPLSPGYALAQNNSGGVINQGEVVELDGSSVSRNVKKVAIARSPTVFGVAMHTVANGLPIIVARPGCPDVVQVKVDPTLTFGGAACPAVHGDLLASVVTAGTARSIDVPPLTAFGSTGFPVGSPIGAFAIALKDRAVVDGVGLTPVRMLPAVGTGCRVFISRFVAISDKTPANGVGTQWFPGRKGNDVGAADNAGQDATESGLISTKHAPAIAYGVEWEAEMDDATAAREADLTLTDSLGIGVNVQMRSKRYSTSPHRFIERAQLACNSDGSLIYNFTTPLGVYGTITTWRLLTTDYTY